LLERSSRWVMGRRRVVLATWLALLVGATIATTPALVFAIAHAATMATYVTNLVELIGLALAIDYSLLVVYRFREELARADAVEEAVVRTLTRAGRSVVFSGAAVALGLALLLFIPSSSAARHSCCSQQRRRYDLPSSLATRVTRRARVDTRRWTRSPYRSC
jgi:uncharacterized membrane protein YdfJ with MMPL/SSD domain